MYACMRAITVKCQQVRMLLICEPILRSVVRATI